MTAGGDCSNEIKRHLLFGRKVMINLGSILKSRDITLPTKGPSSQGYGFSNSHSWMWELLSCVQLFVTQWTAAHQASLSFTISHWCSNSYHWVSDAILPSHPLSSPSAFYLSQHWTFLMSQLFASGGQSIGISASTSVLPVNIQDWFPLGWTSWISWCEELTYWKRPWFWERLRAGGEGDDRG